MTDALVAALLTPPALVGLWALARTIVQWRRDLAIRRLDLEHEAGEREEAREDTARLALVSVAEEERVERRRLEARLERVQAENANLRAENARLEERCRRLESGRPPKPGARDTEPVASEDRDTSPDRRRR